MNAQEMIDAILDYASEHPEFDSSFVEAMQETLEEWGALTNAQFRALENIVNGFRLG